jgi:hypothetical protein
VCVCVCVCVCVYARAIREWIEVAGSVVSCKKSHLIAHCDRIDGAPVVVTHLNEGTREMFGECERHSMKGYEYEGTVRLASWTLAVLSTPGRGGISERTCVLTCVSVCVCVGGGGGGVTVPHAPPL